MSSFSLAAILLGVMLGSTPLVLAGVTDPGACNRANEGAPQTFFNPEKKDAVIRDLIQEIEKTGKVASFERTREILKTHTGYEPGKILLFSRPSSDLPGLFGSAGELYSALENTRVQRINEVTGAKRKNLEQNSFVDLIPKDTGKAALEAAKARLAEPARWVVISEQDLLSQKIASNSEQSETIIAALATLVDS
jgi:hypothetical protein